MSKTSPSLSRRSQRGHSSGGSSCFSGTWRQFKLVETGELSPGPMPEADDPLISRGPKSTVKLVNASLSEHTHPVKSQEAPGSRCPRPHFPVSTFPTPQTSLLPCSAVPGRQFEPYASDSTHWTASGRLLWASRVAQRLKVNMHGR